MILLDLRLFDAWKKSSPNWRVFMVIEHGTIRKTPPTKQQIQDNYPLKKTPLILKLKWFQTYGIPLSKFSQVGVVQSEQISK